MKMLEILLATVEISTGLLVVVAIFIAMAFAAPIFGLLVYGKFKIATLEARYEAGLDELKEQLKNNLISEECYRTMKLELDQNYLKFFEKDLK